MVNKMDCNFKIKDYAKLAYVVSSVLHERMESYYMTN